MAKQQQPQQRRPATPQPKRPAPAAPTPVRKKESRENLFTAGKDEFIFGRTNFIFLGIGLALVLLGLVTMAGGAMPDPNTWDPNIIYSFRRITLAPIMMVAGFVVVIVGIFKKTASGTATEEDNTPAA